MFYTQHYFTLNHCKQYFVANLIVGAKFKVLKVFVNKLAKLKDGIAISNLKL